MEDIRHEDSEIQERDERDYLLSRAEAHRHLAEDSADPASRAAHWHLQKLYSDRAKAAHLVLLDQSSPQGD